MTNANPPRSGRRTENHGVTATHVHVRLTARLKTERNRLSRTDIPRAASERHKLCPACCRATRGDERSSAEGGPRADALGTPALAAALALRPISMYPASPPAARYTSIVPKSQSYMGCPKLPLRRRGASGECAGVTHREEQSGARWHLRRNGVLLSFCGTALHLLRVW